MNRRNENQSVIVSGTSIHPRSKITAGAIINRAADRECSVAMTHILLVQALLPVRNTYYEDYTLVRESEGSNVPPPDPGRKS
jgi:hypothetical protein